MITGGILAWFLVPPDKIVRKDGTRVQRLRHPSILSELKGLYETLYTDPYVLLLFPFFWASNWFYTYQQNAYNLYMFNTRSRAFTGLWYWLAQIVASLLFGWFLDTKKLTRRKRALAGWAVLFLTVNAVVRLPPPPIPRFLGKSLIIPVGRWPQAGTWHVAST
jgi:hypothetical protein